MPRKSDELLNSDELYTVILKILAVSVLIDRQERDRELIEFTHAAMLHNHDLRPGIMLSRKMIINWFKDHRAALIEALAVDEDNSFKEQLLSQITDTALQRRIICSIFTISICDYELHDEESDFIKMTLKIWKTHMPSPAEVEAVA